MKLAAIFNVWSDWQMLGYAVDNIRQLVDGVIIVGSTRSNYNEYSPIPSRWHNEELYIREPKFHLPMHAETDKRNYGLELARKQGYTHFINLDADEFYKPDDFNRGKEMFHVDPDLAGLVCNCQTYFKSPTLTIGLDTTLVPFIHKITPTLKFEFNKRYPFAWIDGQIRIDPTRSMNINSGVERIDINMHHFSWVRDDYEKKIRNSTARKNLERSTIVKDLLEAKEGYFVEFYGKRLTRVENSFGIPEYEFNPDRQAGVRKGL